MSRIAATFKKLRKEKRLALIAYLTVGYPSLDMTPELVAAAAEAGADAIELGIPFSDPLADGPTIQAASQVALKGGVNISRALQAAAAARARTDIPILFMTYLNPLLSYGLMDFCDEARSVGVDGLIVPDLPASESSDLQHAADWIIDLVFFVSPTSSPQAIEEACRAATGFIYCIAVTGVTGARSELGADVIPLIERVRARTKLPIVVGFGISRPEHLNALAGKADGVIVASALLDAINKAPADATGQVRRFVAGLRASP